jgi:hypothetical protein
MAATTTDGRPDGRTGTRTTPPRRVTTETKSSFKTSEFFVMIAAIAGILVASYADADSFARDDAWTLVAIVAVGYMISRGLAKLGNREPYWDDDRH